MHFKYFAYGSNMHVNRLRERIGEFRVHGTAVLPGFRLAWHKLGADGSGKCDIVHTAEPDHAVHGVVYEIHIDQKTALDRFEGLGRGYDERGLVLHREGKRLQAYAYVAHAAHIDPEVLPYGWYKAFVVAGARHHGLPAHYIESISRAPALADPDPVRHAANELILTGVAG
jgi:gamma-glutamylcyclotransferase